MPPPASGPSPLPIEGGEEGKEEEDAGEKGRRRTTE